MGKYYNEGKIENLKIIDQVVWDFHGSITWEKCDMKRGRDYVNMSKIFCSYFKFRL